MSHEISFLFATALAGGLVLLTALIHYEVLRFLSDWVPTLVIVPRLRILVAIIGVFVAHTIEVWVFALAYFGLDVLWDVGAFVGETSGHLFDYVYFSIVVYTSLGFGDIVPMAHTRLLSGVEALTGLVMIGWSASFTYLMMERFWPLHRR
ncbi:MAG: ion channel [Candidatus Binatia bacterium]